LAFEFARVLADSGGIRTKGGDRLDYVVFISGKETEFNPQTGREQEFVLRQFATAKEQFAQILYHSGFLNESAINTADEESLSDLLDELFANFSGLIVVDDIDALTRRKVDTGEESLFIKAVQAPKRTRILYTLRFPPGHAVKSAVAVPGLDSSNEFPDFVSACCDQFGVTQPTALDTPEIERVTSRLPLLIETVLGLRLFSGSYKEALTTFSERGGDDARRYLYQREYDRLNQEGKSRQLLAGLVLLNEPVSFVTLVRLFQYSRDQLLDAISECSSVFLASQQDSGGDTLYQLTAPSIPFLNTVSQKLSYFGALQRKVQHLKSDAVKISPKESELIATLERLIRQQDYYEMVKLWEAVPSDDLAHENPKIRSLLGQAYGGLGSHHREKARECFKHAEGMGYFDVFMMRRWYHLEFTSGYAYEEAERICFLVINREEVGLRFKSEFWSKLGSCLFLRSMSIVGINRQKATDLLRQSIAAYLEAIWIGRSSKDIDISDTFHWMEKPLDRFVALIGSDVEQLFGLFDLMIDRKHDLDVEGTNQVFKSFAKSSVRLNDHTRQRLKGLCARTVVRIHKSIKPISQFPGFQHLISTLDQVSTGLAVSARA
jgi:hypothetical protein